MLISGYRLRRQEVERRMKVKRYQAVFFLFRLDSDEWGSFADDDQRDLPMTNFRSHLSCFYTDTHTHRQTKTCAWTQMPFIRTLICIHLFFPIRTVVLVAFVLNRHRVRSLRRIFFLFVQTIAECAHRQRHAVQWEEQERRKIKKMRRPMSC